MADPVVGPTIEQLRTYCPPFAGRVAGAAQFRLGLQNYNTSMPLPAGYVVPLDQIVDPDRNLNMVGLQQYVHKTIGVIVEFDAQPDRRGQAPVMDYDEMEAALFAAVLNWSPVTCRVPNNQGYFFSGGRFLDLDRARLFYQWEFNLVYQITDEDGWNPDFNAVDLRAIELDIYHKPGAAPVQPEDVPAAEVLIATNPPMEPLGPPPWPDGWADFQWSELL